MVLERVESAKLPEPDKRVHFPIPMLGVFAASVALVPQSTWSEPALAVVGGMLIVRFVVLADPMVEGVLAITRMRYKVPATDGNAILLVMVPADTEVNVPILVGVAKDPVLLESCAVNTLPEVYVPLIVNGIPIPN